MCYATWSVWNTQFGIKSLWFGVTVFSSLVKCYEWYDKGKLQLRLAVVLLLLLCIIFLYTNPITLLYLLFIKGLDWSVIPANDGSTFFLFYVILHCWCFLGSGVCSTCTVCPCLCSTGCECTFSYTSLTTWPRFTSPNIFVCFILLVEETND